MCALVSYRQYSGYLAGLFGVKVQKVSLSIGNSCPNRDGTIGRGGCAYCNNASFSPALDKIKSSVTEQIEAGKQFFRRKYPDMKFLAYFQSYTNTHGADISALVSAYREAMRVQDVVGIIIGTRPDCVPDELLSALRDLEISEKKRIMMEYGAESSFNETLERVNRCHTWETTVDAVRRTRKYGFETGLHFIMGLPGETEEMMLRTVDALNTLDIRSVKFHQLQIIKGTPLAAEYLKNPDKFDIFTVERYLDLCRKIAGKVRPDIAIERFTSSAPAGMVIAPRWGLKNYEFVHRLTSMPAVL